MHRSLEEGGIVTGKDDKRSGKIYPGKALCRKARQKSRNSECCSEGQG